MPRYTIALAVLFGVTSLAQPRRECAYLTPVATTLCESAPLKLLDKDVRRLYRAAFQAAAVSPQTKDFSWYLTFLEETWANENSQCPVNSMEACLIKRYQERAAFWKAYRIGEHRDEALKDKKKALLAGVPDVINSPLGAALLGPQWDEWASAVEVKSGSGASVWSSTDTPCWTVMAMARNYFQMHNPPPDIVENTELDIAVDTCKGELYLALWEFDGQLVLSPRSGDKRNPRWASTAAAWPSDLTELFRLNPNATGYWDTAKLVAQIGKASARVIPAPR